MGGQQGRGYPIILDVAGKACLVLGGGREADEKAATLAECGARVERRERYEAGCLKGFFLAVAAGADRSANAEIFSEAERSGVLLNAMDDPDHCRFIYPSVVRRGELIVAVSTTGACPALAVRLRERLEEELGPEYAEFLDLARGLRERLAQAVPEFERRRALWYALVDSPALQLLRSGDRPAAEATLEALLIDALP